MKRTWSLVPLLMAFPLFAQDLVLSDQEAGVFQAPGWTWESFADTVMGGNSELVPPRVVTTEAGSALLLAGRVVTKGGGFIQTRLKYGEKSFDASGYAGIEVSLAAPAEGNYFVFLRTRDNFFPWSYYSAPLAVTPEKNSFRLPWSAFTAESTGKKTVRPDRLSSVALTAAFKDFISDLRIYRVALYSEDRP